MNIELTAMTLSEMSVEVLQETVARLDTATVGRLLSVFCANDIIKEHARRMMRDQMEGDEKNDIEPMCAADAFETILEDRDMASLVWDDMDWAFGELRSEPEFQ